MRGVIFTFDALFALLLLSATMPLIFLAQQDVVRTQQTGFQAESAIDSLTKITVRNVIREPVIADLYSSGVVTDLDKPVMELLIDLWTSNSTANYTIAKNITEKLVAGMVPKNVKWSLSLGGEALVDTGNGSVTTGTGRRMASGFLKGQQSEGFVSGASLLSISSKRASSYFFFGGFVGQGNITAQLGDIPAGANVSELYLELNAGENFSFYVNNVLCAPFNASGNFSVGKFTINSSACINPVVPGIANNFTINFTRNNLTNEYVGGGFLRAVYTTNNLVDGGGVGYRFPGINGVINLYDSFYVPGNITGMDANVTVFLPSNHTLIFNVGNVTVINYTGDGQEVTLNVSNASFAQILAAKGINFVDLSGTTVPLRAFVTANITGGVLNSTTDIVLITDTSGSMAWRLDQDGTAGATVSNCSSPSIYNPSTSRISLAKCLDKSFVNAALGGNNSACATKAPPGNRVALVGFSTSANNWENLTDNVTYLESRVDAYAASGGTCISCAINRAYDILVNQSGVNRTKYIIVMTDGQANYRSTPVCYDMNGVSANMSVGESGAAVTRTSSWNPVTGASANMNAVDAVNSTFARAVADGGEVYYWSGSWILEQDTGADNLYGVDVFNSTLAFAVGASAKIWQWNGLTWSQAADFGNFNFRAVAFLNGTFAFAVGDSGVIYNWTGSSWSLYQDVGANDLYSVAVYNSTLAYAVGASGKIYRWSGTTWTEMADTGSNIHHDVVFLNGTKAFTASSNGRIYEWNGSVWSSVLVSQHELRGVHAVDSASAYSAGSMYGDIYEWTGSVWSRTQSAFYYNGTSSTGVNCADDDSCSLTVPDSYSAMNANYSAFRAAQAFPNITVDSIGFGPIGTCQLGNQTVTEIAKTGAGTAYSSANATELQDIYCQIVNNIVTRSTETQQVISEGSAQPSVLSPSSRIDFSYVPAVTPAEYQEITVSGETGNFSGCSGSFFVAPVIKITEALRTSYSGVFWTKALYVENNETNSSVFNLSRYGKFYSGLGDPFRVYLPAAALVANYTSIVRNELGLNSTESSPSCSNSDRIIYKARLRASVPFGAVFPELSGGVVRVYHDVNHDGLQDGFTDMSVGASLPGYDPTPRTIDQLSAQNALHDAVVRLMASLNFVVAPFNSGLPGTSSNPIDMVLGDVSIDTTGTGGIPFAWGPVDIRLDVKV